MYHYTNAARNTHGEVLTGFFVRAVNAATNTGASLYADENLTPIVSVSGIADAALVDSDGNIDFYVGSGTYHLDYYAPDGTSLIKRVRNVPMTQNIADTTGVFSATPNGFGYSVGNGGVATQLTSRTTAVTVNKPTGQITMFSAAGTTAWSAFTVNNSCVTANDTVALSVSGGSNTYIAIPAVATGSFVVVFSAINGTATDAPKINFTVIKGQVA